MSDHDELPTFTGSADPKEEALWQAYQAMLRRRQDPPPRWSGAEGRSESDPSPERSESIRWPAPAGTARRIFPRDPEAWAREPSPVVFRPVDAPVPDPQGAGGRPGLGLSIRRRLGAGVALGMAAGLGLGAAMAIAFWPHDRPNPVAVKADRSPTPTRTVGASAIPKSPPTLPCVAGGRLIGQFTLEDCTRRDGVASGSLQVEEVVPAPTPLLRPPRPSRLAGRASALEPHAPPRLVTRLAAAAPPRYDTNAGSRLVTEVPPQRASVLAVHEFYEALARGDGEGAAAVVVPEKREAGPLSAEEMTRFFSQLRAPLRITEIDPINDDTVFVSYQFVTADDHLCRGTARVSTEHRDGDTLVTGIRTFSGC
jgi:hypothetical protein